MVLNIFQLFFFLKKNQFWKCPIFYLLQDDYIYICICIYMFMQICIYICMYMCIYIHFISGQAHLHTSHQRELIERSKTRTGLIIQTWSFSLPEKLAVVTMKLRAKWVGLFGNRYPRILIVEQNPLFFFQENGGMSGISHSWTHRHTHIAELPWVAEPVRFHSHFPLLIGSLAGKLQMVLLWSKMVFIYSLN